MKRVMLAAIITVFAASAYAQDATCKSQSSDKNLRGAAEKSFLTKCEKDARTACDTQAKEKKLAGAARTSFTKKCVTDAVGT
jgi:psiF repeat